MGLVYFSCLDINELCIREIEDFNACQITFQITNACFFCCPKSKQGPLVIWGKTGIFSGRGHENKCESSNGPIPTMTS